MDTIFYTFDQGKVYAILGRSGAGKTTLLSLLAGLDTPVEGEMLVDGELICKKNLRTHRQRNVSLVFQNYNLIDYLTPKENVLLGLPADLSANGTKKKSELCETQKSCEKTKDCAALITSEKIKSSVIQGTREKIKTRPIPETYEDQKAYEKPGRNKAQVQAQELLYSVGLTKTEIHRNVMKLSGGQQQRVAIARALAGEAQILLADEPTGNLDEATANEIMDLFLALAHEKQKCVIIVTHSQELAQKADVILYLENGMLLRKS